MCKKSDFFILLLEKYAFHHGITGDQMLERLKQNDMIDYIYDMYELYHVETLSNAFDDLDAKMKHL